MNWAPSSERRLAPAQSNNHDKKERGQLALLMLLSYVGFVNAMYLTINHYRGEVIGCPVGFDCGEVLSGPFSSIGGVPVALLGVSFFGLNFIIAAALFAIRNVHTGLLTVFASTGFAVSVFLFFVQWLVLKAFCMYCLFSGISATSIFLLVMYMRYSKARMPHE